MSTEYDLTAPNLPMNHPQNVERRLRDEIERLRAEVDRLRIAYMETCHARDALKESDMWDLAIQMNCDFNRIYNQRNTIQQMQREIRYLRQYGNNDCTAAAYEAMTNGSLD